ncbi:hypothetical protein BC629DRAFT_1590599 [Irpex lacteus]|nr:hypothetical protein BC629DRAFT_1590599 [Irpex lacteus]
MALPVHEEAVLDTDVDEAIQGDGDDINCVPVTPAFLLSTKYQRRYYHPQRREGEAPEIKALQTKFKPLCPPTSRCGSIEFIWRPCTSPEGSLYFIEKKWNIMTFVDLYNDNHREQFTTCALSLLHKIEKQKDKLPKDAEIVIMVEDYGAGVGYGYGYYLATWEDRCVFWLEDVDCDYITMQGGRVCTTETHIAKYLEYLFCAISKNMPRRVHMEMFPCHHGTPRDVIEDLKIMLNFGIYDHVSSNNSIFPYDKTEASDILRCLERVKPLKPNAYDMWIVARCKQNLAEYMFINFHGERGARIHRNDSVLRGKIRTKRSLGFLIITPFLFFVPSVYMKEIENVWIDNTADHISWRKFTTLLYRDWNQSMTPATVILSANIGFLAIQSIDTDHPDRSAAQISSYISAVLSFFFFITVQILTYQHRSSDYFSAMKACYFFSRREKQWGGLESIAITFSLPTALFIWSMLAFLVALMIVFFWHTSIATRVSLGTLVVILMATTVIMLWLDWNNHWGSPEIFESRSLEGGSDPEPQNTVLYRIIPPGLRQAVLGVRERWQPRGIFRVKSRKRSSNASIAESDVSTVVEEE